MRIVIDELAVKDLNAIGEWIARDNLNAAKEVVQIILQAIAYLETFPRMGHTGRTKDTYECDVSGTSYIVVYELWEKPSAVVVTAVFHGARNR